MTLPGASRSFNPALVTAQLFKMERFYTLLCFFTLFTLASSTLNIKNEHFKRYSRIFKDVGRYSRTTRCFSRIKGITSFISKFKDNSWRSRTSGNLSYATVKCACSINLIKIKAITALPLDRLGGRVGHSLQGAQNPHFFLDFHVPNVLV